jgi:hypothetical protein
MISAPEPRTGATVTHPGQPVIVAVVVNVPGPPHDAIFPQVTTGSIAIDHAV